MKESITFAATGDSFITRSLPVGDKKHKEISDIIKQADVRFTNLEVTVHDFEGIPSAVSGGAWAVAHPKVLKDLSAYGFNIMSWATNHTLDFSYGGLDATKKYLDEHNFIHAGAGSDLAEASKPRYLETQFGRVALISATSTFHETWRAGASRPDMVGRPGINPLRFNMIYEVSQENMKSLKSISEKININALNNLHTKIGIRSKSEDNLFSFGSYNFKVGDKEQETTTPYEEDMNRILGTIDEAKRQADYVIVSIHSHEMKGESIEQPADFLEAFSRKCIDKGADSVIGHGPHLLRGIEIYKNRPIFYSLGNFIFQNDTMLSQPADAYTKHGLNSTNNVADLFDARTSNDTKGFVVDEKIWSSVIPIWKMREGELTSLILHPIDLGMKNPRSRRGWPEISHRTDVLKELQELSLPFGTTIQIKNGVGEIEINQK